MRKEIQIIKYIDICDFCGATHTSDNWLYTCDVCEKHVCEQCLHWIEASDIYKLHVCKDCANLDFSEYKKLAVREVELYKEIDEIRDKEEEILEKLKEGTGVGD